MTKRKPFKRKINDVASVREGRALSSADDNLSALTLPKGKPHSGNIVLIQKGKWYPKAYLKIIKIPQKTKEQDWIQVYIAVPKASNMTQPPLICFGMKKIDQKINLTFNDFQELMLTLANLYKEIEKSALGIMKAHLKELANWRKLHRKYLELYDIPFRDKSGKSASQLDFDFLIYYDAINSLSCNNTVNTVTNTDNTRCGFNALHPKGKGKKALKNQINPLRSQYKADTIP